METTAKSVAGIASSAKNAMPAAWIVTFSSVTRSMTFFTNDFARPNHSFGFLPVSPLAATV